MLSFYCSLCRSNSLFLSLYFFISHSLSLSHSSYSIALRLFNCELLLPPTYLENVLSLKLFMLSPLLINRLVRKTKYTHFRVNLSHLPIQITCIFFPRAFPEFVYIKLSLLNQYRIVVLSSEYYRY